MSAPSRGRGPTTGREYLTGVYAYDAGVGHVGLQGHVGQPLVDGKMAATGC